MRQPLVSIVMPSYNQACFIKHSINSVFSQSYSNIELIISDGGSSDGTIDYLRQISGQLPRLKWMSEPDSGPAHAINKALNKVQGEIVGWLNSDDLYASGAISRAVSSFGKHPEWILNYGHGTFVDETGNNLRPYPTKTPDAGLNGFSSGSYICQPTVFFKTPMLSMVGMLNETLSTSFDYEYWLRVFRDMPQRIGFIHSVQAHSRLHDNCITARQRETVSIEGLQLSKTFLGRPELHWITTHLEEIRSETTSDIDFKQKAEKVLRRAKPYLTSSQYKQLHARVW